MREPPRRVGVAAWCIKGFLSSLEKKKCKGDARNEKKGQEEWKKERTGEEMKKDTDGKNEIRKKGRGQERERENDVAVYMYLRHGAAREL